MSITVAAWNVQEGLDIPDRSKSLLEGVKQLDSDVVVLTDAFWPGNPLHQQKLSLLHEAEDAFTNEGYTVHPLAYEDAADPYPDRFMLTIARIGMEMAGVNLDGRNAMKLTIPENSRKNAAKLEIFGVHLDDRHEHRRVKQAYSLVSEMQDSAPTAIIGDLNTLARNTLPARVIGATFGKLQNADHISRRVPDRLRAIASKLGDMASGVTLDVFEQAGLHDISTGNATFPSRLPLLELDRCLVSPSVHASIQSQPHRAGSDHRAIKVVLES